jgi:limonene-1,2-epoxide hydrolase
MNDATLGEPPAAGKPAPGTLATAVERYGRFWSGVRPDTTLEILALARPDLRFVDLFNDVVGATRVAALLDHMFAAASDVRFTILHQAWAGDTAFYRWDFACRLKRPRTQLALVGVSEVRFASDGLVAEHVDHWDAGTQVYERVPGLGTLLRLIKRRLSAGV